jgi:O-acetyl-ADP-ribose deacetylase (regulator of RNase III)
LKQTYVNCLNLAKEHNIKEIAFCCLSTGIFGFPKKKSAEVALATIRDWISESDYKFKHIIFNVYIEEDFKIYTELFNSKNISCNIASFI